jgi:hypothetical protein
LLKLLELLEELTPGIKELEELELEESKLMTPSRQSVNG